MSAAFVTGFATGFSLILAIGAQNAFVLRQGLMQAHVFWICLVCALSDAALITLGVVGAGSLGAAFPWAIEALTWAGVLFLIGYGALSLRRALRPRALMAMNGAIGSLRLALVTCLALTFLNPHVYLDTVGLIGAISTGFAGIEGKLAYAIGAILASFVFFFGLGYGARLVAPVFAQPRAWALLDVGIALVMWGIAAGLAAGASAALPHRQSVAHATDNCEIATRWPAGVLVPLAPACAGVSERAANGKGGSPLRSRPCARVVLRAVLRVGSRIA